MYNNCTRIARQILNIEEDLLIRVRRGDYPPNLSFKQIIDNLEIFIFPQTWSSTALGFDGIGGCALTTENTYVFVSKNSDNEPCYVYFGDKFAYAIPKCTKTFLEDIKKHQMASIMRSAKYY